VPAGVVSGSLGLAANEYPFNPIVAGIGPDANGPAGGISPGPFSVRK